MREGRRHGGWRVQGGREERRAKRIMPPLGRYGNGVYLEAFGKMGEGINIGSAINTTS